MAGKNAYIRVDVDLGTALTKFVLASQRVRCVSLNALSVPAGLTQCDVNWGTKAAIPIQDGDTWKFDPEEDGIFLTTSPALPGQIATFVIGVDAGCGGQGINRNV